MKSLKHVLPLALLTGSFSAGQSLAADMQLSVAIPEMNVAEYHRPYVAVWAMNKDDKAVTNGAVWYQIDDDGEGEKWLKDMRLWWRRSGRSLEVPIDGVTGATRKPGEYEVSLTHVAQQLTPGDYVLYVEAAREVGGRELLSVDFSWPSDETQTLSAQGDSELGAITLTITP
ncbi:DUF2271 domain-containing protein [Gilvimarinus xylanilyticus]|uniref:DUF2271 domain-containing protein n=1 Tax=Gilvimarinus xylanilyticus TaxID=2944139 RepID=A0A9X2HUK4_9GAMM|nr:DUF2271 domain-containing protein [Gilvimarinus xylanilyticus]MCP8898495.1 DUF2271 domain-containing protein [Gilvimarinus xylanilyticus]